MIKIILPKLKPISVNQAYAIVRGRKVKTKIARDYANYIEQYIFINYKKEINLIRESIKTSSIILTYNIFNIGVLKKNGSLHKKFIDCGNCDKLLTDSFFNVLGLDDYLITKLTICKKYSHENCIEIIVDFDEKCGK
ncbi:MAG: RusA family crossover junction endodeoxyribonuclease [Candidatus Peregrinibacteria bacterium]|nr:RusA family crossover junction endodeoxyribonuclease [Candidatus Peregrinibacteria bacterium]